MAVGGSGVWIGRHSGPAVFMPDAIIVREGFPLRAVHFIHQGTVQLERAGAPCALLGNSDNFGIDDYSAACFSVDSTSHCLQGYCSSL